MNKAARQSNLEGPRTAPPEPFGTRDCFLGETIFRGPEGVWFHLLPASHGWCFACFYGPVAGLPKATAGTDWGLGTILEDRKKLVYAALHTYTDCFKIDMNSLLEFNLFLSRKLYSM